MTADFYSSFAVAAALLGVWLKNWQWLDGLFGLLVSIWLLKGAILSGSDAFQQLIDRALPAATLKRVTEIVTSTNGVISQHRLRSRQSGATKIVDLHIVVPNTWTVVEAHEAADSIEKRIKSEFDPAIVIVHVDPFDPLKVGR